MTARTATIAAATMPAASASSTPASSSWRRAMEMMLRMRSMAVESSDAVCVRARPHAHPPALRRPARVFPESAHDTPHPARPRF